LSYLFLSLTKTLYQWSTLRKNPLIATNIRLNSDATNKKKAVTNLNASTSRRWHFCLLKVQKPPHPVGSLWSRIFLHIGTISPKMATHNSPSKQSSQYLVALITFWLAASVSTPSFDGEVLPGNDRLPLIGALMANIPPANVSSMSVIDVNVIVSVAAVVRFDSSFTGVIGSPEVTFCPVNLLVDDFRYCWIIWSFSGSEKKRGVTRSIIAIEKAR